ncbi:hypothetical protein MRX96_026213 [Rhipicephalus microplus]
MGASPFVRASGDAHFSARRRWTLGEAGAANYEQPPPLGTMRRTSPRRVCVTPRPERRTRPSSKLKHGDSPASTRCENWQLRETFSSASYAAAAAASVRIAPNKAGRSIP